MSESRGIERGRIGDARPVRAASMVALLLLTGPPLAFLAAQVLRYALVGPACELGSVRVLLEAATLIGLAGVLGVAWLGWKHADRRLDAVGQEAEAQSRFLGTVALGLAALFLLAGVALWLPSLFLSPCGRP